MSELTRIKNMIRDYVKTGGGKGGFVEALITNNLKEAAALAGSEELKQGLPELVAFMTCHIPQEAWGSKTNVRRWRRTFAMKRRAIEALVARTHQVATPAEVLAEMESPRYSIFIDSDVLDALYEYLDTGREQSSFIMACLEGDLMAAATKASGCNISELPHIMRHLYTYFPKDAHGSKRTVRSYMTSVQEGTLERDRELRKLAATTLPKEFN